MGTGPDPEAARTPAEFVHTMRQLRSWADLSYRQLERRADDAGDALPRATISSVLARGDLPREELLGAFVRACGGNAATVEAWLEVRRRLAMNAQPAPGGNGEPPPASAEAITAISDRTSPPEEPSPAPPSATVDETATEPPSDDGTAVDVKTDPQPGTDTSAGSETSLAQDDGDQHTANAPSPQVPATAPGHGGRPTRTRHLPMALTGACAAVGVLVLALWPNGGQIGNAQPEDSPRITAGPTKSTPAPTPSTTPDKIQPSKTAAKPPVAVRTSSGMPEAGWVEMHPDDAPSRCITEGSSELTERIVAVRGRCSHLDYPQIYLESLGDLVYRLKPAFQSGCLGGDGYLSGDTDLAPSEKVELVSTWDCTDPEATHYRLEPSGNGYRLRLTDSSKCLGMQEVLIDGSELIQAECTGASDQLFTFTPAQAPVS
ncbi:RICIN domain-containing protein [Streptomyces sp. NPDC058280]|uniref:RICIN domain-containing protein n=1 Tax=Streptomyces sp. NPDC058280 TaxID=3346419 RepID=UPI0036E84ABD